MRPENVVSAVAVRVIPRVEVEAAPVMMADSSPLPENPANVIDLVVVVPAAENT